MKKRILASLLGSGLAFSVLALNASSANQSSLVVQNSVQELIEVVDAQGNKQIKSVPTTSVVPGDLLLYSMRLVNRGQKVTDRVKVTSPIPKHTKLVRGSVSGAHFDVNYSVDGGNSFAKPQSLRVRNADGTIRLANEGDYSHIQWTYNKSMNPGETKVVSFKAKLQ